ncbi:uncharacterized protein LOC127736722 [Mytilus californianus]|uniref:uncharacterized protein LOC127736722 n=1 Tax=Mytilus californianus TaxID=6549 RepID=UPI00224608CE|nr:uncharacterized protein LOC127736722 [Mytilus californianus]
MASQYFTAAECMLAGLNMEDKEFINSNFYVKKVRKRGRSVFAKRAFKKGDYVMEYKGICKMYTEKEFLSTQMMYESNEELSYCLEFTFQNQKYYIDATREYDYGIARLINHARNPNIKLFRPVLVETDKLPRIAMYAATNISAGEELFWDYFSSLNPVKCLLDQTNSTVTSEMQWIFSKRTKSGGIICPSKKRIPHRSGLCTICYEFKKKLSNHLINVHSVKSVITRRKMIKDGRKHSKLASTFCKTPKKKSLWCPFCHRDYKQLSTHLSRIHSASADMKKAIIRKNREKEIKKRKTDFLQKTEK